MTFGLFATYGYVYRNMIPKDADPRVRGNLESFSDYFQRPIFMAPGPLTEPENPLYTGPVYVLQDRFCGSACEDFVMPLKASHRATLIGERTFGSSGQPYLFTFPNGMTFRVSAKRMYLPDGSEFEGIGIPPTSKSIRRPAPPKTSSSKPPSTPSPAGESAKVLVPSGSPCSARGPRILSSVFCLLTP